MLKKNQLKLELKFHYFFPEKCEEMIFSLKLTNIAENFHYFYDIFPLCSKLISIHDRLSLYSRKTSMLWPSQNFLLYKRSTLI